MDVTAIIPTLINQAGLKHLLFELNQAGLPAIVIMNQAKTSPEVSEVNSSGVVWLRAPNNLGFAAAINLGAKQARTKWLLILNDDVEGISRTAIERISELAHKNGWAAVSPVLVKPNRAIENIGYKVLPIGRVELNFDKEKNSDKDLDGLTAACLLIKREIFEKLSGFDEKFFAYLEDVDLFLRLKEKSYYFGVVTDTEVVHQHLTTSKQMGSFKSKQDLINWWRIVFKHPTKFILSPALFKMFVERGRNLSGWVKAYAN